MPYRLLARAASRAGGRLGWSRPALCALLGILFAAVANHVVSGISGAAMPWLFAPLGASAVLVFALPASPLAQPWPVLGGNLLSALIGLATARLVPYPELACAVAVGAAIAAMSLARCLHPPGGACALLAAIGGPLSLAEGSLTLLLPLASNLVALIAAGWFCHRLGGHDWPHRAAKVPQLPQGSWAGHYSPADLDHVLEGWDEVLDVSRDDLDALFRAVESRVEHRIRKQAKARERALRGRKPQTTSRRAKHD